MVGEARAKAVAAGIAAGMVSAMALLTLSQGKAAAKPMFAGGLSEIVAKAVAEAATDPFAARAHMDALYRRNRLISGDDYVAAARLFLASDATADLALAHDFAIAGLVLGDLAAKPLVAQTEDRLFAKAGLGERYGTLGGKALPLTERHRSLLYANPQAPIPAVD